MLGFSAFDTAIGLCLFFLLVSLLGSGLREGGETVLKSRARDLERGLRMVLDDAQGVVLMPTVLSHGLLSSLSDGDYDPGRLRKSWFGGGLHLPAGTARAGFPSYIPARQFASALIDVIARGPSEQLYPVSSRPLTAAGLRLAATRLPSTRLQRVVLSALDTAGDDLERTRRELEKWFDGSMDRVSGWYKRRTQIVLFCIGLTLAIVLNLDALTVAARLNADPTLRSAAVAGAQSVQAQPGADAISMSQAQTDIDRIGYPIGWRRDPRGWPVPGPQACPDLSKACAAPALGLGGVVEMVIGWLITAFAVTLGAPFWFDLLNRFMVIRSTVKPAQKSPDEASADPQPKRARNGDGDSHAAEKVAAPPATAPPPASTPPSTPGQASLPPPDWSEGDDLPAWRPGFVNEEELAL